MAGIAYYIFVMVTGIRFPCFFKEISGYDCPGCGITRMLIAITKFDFKAAFGYNPVLFVTLPIMLIIYLIHQIRYIRTGERQLSLLMKIAMIVEIVILIAFGILRNII
ncbi:MAG: DUF2752 domain-containing protein [Clostridia bacterium]|nr:DUF2752 domain-containing protein [Clostridia bacterium]